MVFEFCCISMTLVSLAVSDLSQTAEFTQHPNRFEINPIAAPLVDGPSTAGETVLAVTEVSMILFLHQNNSKWVQGLRWMAIVGHTAAVWHNSNAGFKAPAIVFPVLTIRW